MSEPISDRSRGIYEIVRLETGRCYIGKTQTTFRSRWQSHRRELRKGSHHNSELQADWTLYGESAFSFAGLESLDHIPLEFIEPTLSEREVLWLALTPDAYNLTAAGHGGMKASASTIAKLSAERKRRWADPEYRVRTLAAIRGAMTGEKYHRERGAAISAGMQNPEFHALRSALTARQWADGPLREIHREAMVSHWEEPGFRSRQIATRRMNWANPVISARRRVGIQASWDADPVRRSERIAAMRAGHSYPIFDGIVAVMRDGSDWRTPQQIREACAVYLPSMPSTQVVWQGLKRLVAHGEVEKDGPLYRLKGEPK